MLHRVAKTNAFSLKLLGPVLVLSQLQLAEAFAMDLVGLKHDDEAARVEGLHGMLDLIELLVGAGAEHNIPRVAAVAAAPLQDRGAAVGYPVDQAAAPSSVMIMASIDEVKPNIILLMTVETRKLNMIP